MDKKKLGSISMICGGIAFVTGFLLTFIKHTVGKKSVPILENSLYVTLIVLGGALLFALGYILTSFPRLKEMKRRAIGSGLVIVGFTFLLLSCYYNDNILSGGPDSFESLIIFGKDVKTEFSLFNIINFAWLPLLGAVMFIVGFRMNDDGEMILWKYSLISGAVLLGYQYINMLFTDANSLFSLESSSSRTGELWCYFWAGALGLVLLLVGYVWRKIALKPRAPKEPKAPKVKRIKEKATKA